MKRGFDAAGADHLCPDGGGSSQIGGGAGRHLVEPVLRGHHAAHGDLQQRVQLLAALGEALLGVGVLQQAERVPTLHDGEHVELARLAHEVGHRGVPGLLWVATRSRPFGV